MQQVKNKSFVLKVERAGKSDIDNFVLSIIHPERPVLTMKDGKLVETGEVGPAMQFFVGQHTTTYEQEAAHHIKFLIKALMENSYVRDDGVRIFEVLDTNGNRIEVEDKSGTWNAQ